MSPAKAASPARRGDGNGARKKVGFGRLDGHQDSPRNVRQQRLAKHLHACGPRPVPDWALGADRLAIDDVLVIDGGGP